MKGKKTGGRTKDTPNKRTKESLERVEWVLNLLQPTLEEDIQAISSIDRVRLWNDLQEYIRPKLARTTIVGDATEPIAVKYTPIGKDRTDK